MIKIHHATKTKAEKLGVILSVKNEGEPNAVVEALHAAVNRRYYSKDAKEALAAHVLQSQMEVDYPILILKQDEEGLFIVETRHEEPTPVYKGASLPDLADVLDDAQEQGVDLEEAFKEDVPANVVPQRYREEYRAAGHPDHCGDEFAEFCDGKFIGADLKFDLDAYIAFCSLNGLEPTPKLAAMIEAQNRGYVGRARMNLGQMMRRKIAEVGSVKYNVNGEIKTKAFSVEFLETLLAKFPKVEPKWKD